jgi:hypothetical protein
MRDGIEVGRTRLLGALVATVGHPITVCVWAATGGAGTGFVGALVGIIEDAVAVVVGIGAAVVVLKSVRVLGLHRALVCGVGQAVGVVVVVGAAIGVLEPIDVLRSLGAGIVLVEEAITVGVLVADLKLDSDQELEVGGGPVGVGDRGVSEGVDQPQIAAEAQRIGDVDGQTRTDSDEEVRIVLTIVAANHGADASGEQRINDAHLGASHQADAG